MTTASVQLLAGIIRVHESGGFGDPWQWSAVIEADPRRPGLAILWGAFIAPPLSARPAIARKLSDLGFTHVTWERREDGADRWPEFELSRWLLEGEDG